MANEPVTSTPVSGGEVKSNVSSPSASPTQTAGASNQPAQSDKIKIKVNGQDREFTLNELKGLASKGVGADEKFQKAAQLEKQYKDFTDSLKGKQIVKVLEGQGFTRAQIREALESELTPFVQEDLLSPEQRERKEMEARLKKFEEERLAQEREQMTQREQQELNRTLQSLDVELMSALEATKLPKNAWLGKQVAQMMLGAQKNGYNMSAHEAASAVNEQFQRDFKEVVGQMSPAQIKQYLGKDTLSKLRAEDVQAVKDVEKTFTKASSKPVKQASRSSEEPAKKDHASFFNKLRGVSYNKE